MIKFMAIVLLIGITFSAKGCKSVSKGFNKGVREFHRQYNRDLVSTPLHFMNRFNWGE